MPSTIDETRIARKPLDQVFAPAAALPVDVFAGVGDNLETTRQLTEALDLVMDMIGTRNEVDMGPASALNQQIASIVREMAMDVAQAISDATPRTDR